MIRQGQYNPRKKMCVHPVPLRGWGYINIVILEKICNPRPLISRGEGLKGVVMSHEQAKPEHRHSTALPFHIRRYGRVLACWSRFRVCLLHSMLGGLGI